MINFMGTVKIPSERHTMNCSQHCEFAVFPTETNQKRVIVHGHIASTSPAVEYYIFGNKGMYVNGSSYSNIYSGAFNIRTI